MSADSWFKFFSSDFISGVATLSAAERGVYITLLSVMYDRGSPIDRDDARLSRLCGLPKHGFVRALAALIENDKIQVLDDGRLYNNRTKTLLTERKNRVATARANANSRWAKSQQNQPSNDAEVMQPQCNGNADAMLRARVPDTRIEIASAISMGASRPKRQKSRTEIDPNAQPTDSDREDAVKSGLDPPLFRAEWRRFRDHHRAKGSLMADWGAAWRTWLGNRNRFNGRDNGRTNGKSVQAAARDLAASVVDFGPMPAPYMPGGRGDAAGRDPTRLLPQGGRGGPGDVLRISGGGPVYLSAGSGLPSDGPEDRPGRPEPMVADSS